MTTVLITLMFTVALGWLATWLLRWGCTRVGIIDRPDTHRKGHGRAIALGGGVAVLVSLATAVAILYAVENPLQRFFVGEETTLVALLVGSTAICLCGFLDDAFHLRGRQKLAGQVLAAGLLIAFGLSIEKVAILGWEIDLGLLAIPFTLFWLLGATNAVNLLDGIDGLAATLGIILCLAIGVMSWMTGHTMEAIICVAFAGSLLGFLVWNFPPASIYLGDAGSMLIGLLIGALAIRSSLKGPATAALAAPLAIWAIPILDSVAAILRRKLTGRSIYTTDRSHLHHTLLNRGLDNRTTVAFIALLCAVTGIGALASVYWNNELFALFAVVAIVASLVSFRIFGYAELMLVQNRTLSLALSLFKQGRASHRKNVHRLQGTHGWDAVWDGLVQTAEQHGLALIELNINIPLAAEHYYAKWSSPAEEALEGVWVASLPLLLNGHQIGQIRLQGRSEGSGSEQLQRVSTALVAHEDQLIRIAEEALSRVGIAQSNPSTAAAGVPLPVIEGVEAHARAND